MGKRAGRRAEAQPAEELRATVPLRESSGSRRRLRHGTAFLGAGTGHAAQLRAGGAGHPHQAAWLSHSSVWHPRGAGFIQRGTRAAHMRR